MRYKCTNKRRFNIFCIALTMIVILAIFGFTMARADTPQRYMTVSFTTETPTVYDVANKYYISHDINEEIYEIQEHNNLKGNKFWTHIGQDIEIPVTANMKEVE